MARTRTGAFCFQRGPITVLHGRSIYRYHPHSRKPGRCLPAALEKPLADKVKVNIYMSPDMLSALKKLAAKRDVAYAELVRTACRDYIIKNAGQIMDESRTMEAMK